MLRLTAVLSLWTMFSTSDGFHVAHDAAALRPRGDTTRRLAPFSARRRGDDFDDYEEEDEYEDFDEDVFENDVARRRRRRGRRRGVVVDDLDDGFGLPSAFGRRDDKDGDKGAGLRLPESLSKAVLAGVFALGIGTGVTVDSAVNTNPKDLASRDAVDRQAPNPTVCTRYGASAMAFDQRVFVSFNPFNVYVAQADVKPACVLRPANVSPILRDEYKLVNEKEVQSCKKNMNTWAFVGDLEDMPQLSCVYQSEDAQNEFLSNPKLGIGEDVYDDDRERLAKSKTTTTTTTKKMVKDGVRTKAQLKKAFDQAELIKSQGGDMVSELMN